MSKLNPWLSLGAIALMAMPAPGLKASEATSPTFIVPGSPLPSQPAPNSVPHPGSSAQPTPPRPNAPRPNASILQRHHYDRYRQVIERTQAMVSDPIARRLAESFDLNVLNVTWEDTGRFYGSAVGPNISDMTIQVQQQNPGTGQYQLHLMPVIRHPNFADLSADIPLDRFAVLVGNERGDELRRVPLDDLLGNLRGYLHTPSSWAGRGRARLAPARDSHVLVSAQACFLPVPQAGLATFNPVLFNYQS